VLCARFHTAELSRDAPPPAATFLDLFDLALDPQAFVYAVDEGHALDVAEALLELLRFLLDDDTLELIVAGYRLGVDDGARSLRLAT